MQQKIALISFCAALMSAPLVHAENSMKAIVDENNIEQCELQLITLAEKIIGKNEHRLYVDQPKRNADKYPITIVGVIDYHDQESHIQFNAMPIDKIGCEVSYIEAFTLPETCTTVREQVFKKWKFIGRLSENSFFLRHKKNLTQNATLSSVNHGTQCLVTKRDSGI
ncbi:MAG: hypothetical protein COA90_04555 [Gammaproteobacteria bacterium]|nr:MAG: hypothetical protein COA90_04555 [Gammaproteobacteria bacterium]